MADQKPQGQCSEKCDPNCQDKSKEGCCSTGKCTKDQRQCNEKCDPNCQDKSKEGCCSTGTCTKDQHQCADKCASHKCSDKCASDPAACEQKKKNLPGRTQMSPEELEEARKREEARKAGTKQ